MLSLKSGYPLNTGATKVRSHCIYTPVWLSMPLSYLGSAIPNRCCHRAHNEDAQDVDSQPSHLRVVRAAQIPRQTSRPKEEDWKSHRSWLHGTRRHQLEHLSLRRVKASKRNLLMPSNGTGGKAQWKSAQLYALQTRGFSLLLTCFLPIAVSICPPTSPAQWPLFCRPPPPYPEFWRYIVERA